jgi:eukaryotic-like serine/threonine-protein kinase
VLLSIWAEYEDQIGAPSTEHRQRAIEAFQAATRANPRIPEVWINLGRTLLHRTEAPSGSSDENLRAQQEQDLQQAREALQHALELNPQHLVSYLYSGRIHAQQAKLHWCDGGAASLLSTALELYQKGLAINRKPLLFQFNDAIGKIQLAQAQQTWEQGGDPFPLLEKAQSTFEEDIRISPQQPHSYSNLGETLLWRATYKRAQGEDMSAEARKAVSAFEQALQQAKDDPFRTTDLATIYVLLAEASLDKGRDPSPSLQRAESTLRAAMKINPRHARSWRLLGKTLTIQARWNALNKKAREEDFEVAQQAFEKSFALEPGTPEDPLEFGALLHAWALWEKDAGRAPAPQLKRGLALVEKVLSDCPEWPPALLLRSKLRLLQASTEARTDVQHALRTQAREDLSRALVKNPHLTAPGRE